MSEERTKLKNFGYFIVPFCVEENQRTDFFKYINTNTIFSENKNLFNCKYLFRHVNNVFLNQDNKAIIFDVDINVAKDVKLYANIFSQEKEVAKIEQINLIMFSDYLGYLLIKIDYLDMNALEIADFVFSAKRTRALDRNTKTLVNNMLYDLINTILPESICDAFFYSNNKNYQFCDIFQFVTVSNDDDLSPQDYKDYYNKLLFFLGRGYNRDFNFEKNALAESSTDIHYDPFVYYDWCGSQSTLSCIVNMEKVSDSDFQFLESQFCNNINNDYLLEYLILINQKYSTMYLLDKLTQEKIDIEVVENQLNDFKIKYSFKAISNELTYQNIYNKMLNALDIKSLIYDVEDSSERIRANDRKADEKREKTTNNILFILGLLSLGSALIDFSDYFDKWAPISELQVSTWVSAIIVFITLIVTIVIGKPVLSEFKKSFKEKRTTKKRKENNGNRQNIH